MKLDTRILNQLAEDFSGVIILDGEGGWRILELKTDGPDESLNIRALDNTLRSSLPTRSYRYTANSTRNANDRYLNLK